MEQPLPCFLMFSNAASKVCNFSFSTSNSLLKMLLSSVSLATSAYNKQPHNHIDDVSLATSAYNKQPHNHIDDTLMALA